MKHGKQRQQAKKDPVLIDLPLDQQKVVVEVDLDELIASSQPDVLPQATDEEIDKST